MSSCLPQADGDSGRQRAWQLLGAAASTHRVWAVALADGPIRLEHWREVAERCERLIVQPRSWWRRDGGRLTAALSTLDRRQFDAILCCSAGLWRGATQVQAALKVADVASLLAGQREAAEAARWRPWRRGGGVARLGGAEMLSHFDALLADGSHTPAWLAAYGPKVHTVAGQDADLLLAVLQTQRRAVGARPRPTAQTALLQAA
jgi:hypothetical protein